jgi:hypothetical protein
MRPHHQCLRCSRNLKFHARRELPQQKNQRSGKVRTPNEKIDHQRTLISNGLLLVCDVTTFQSPSR